MTKKSLEQVKQIMYEMAGFRTADQIANQADMDAKDIVANLFADENNKQSRILMKELNKYCLPSEFQMEYWWRINRWCDWWANSIDFKCDDKYLEEQFTLCVKYAKMFGRAGLVEIKGKWTAVAVSQYDKVNGLVSYIPSPLMSFNSESFEYKEGKLKLGETAKVAKDTECLVCENTDQRIGDYVYMIPWIGKEIYFERQLQRNVCMTNIWPSTSVADEQQAGQLADMMTSCETWYGDVVEDEQITSKDIDGPRTKWSVPPKEITDTFEMLRNNLKDLREDMKQRFGMPVETTTGKQHLAADANMSVSNYEYIAKDWYNRVHRFIERLVEAGVIVWFTPEESKEEHEEMKQFEEHVEEKFEKQTEEPQKDGATKEGEAITSDVGKSEGAL